MTNSARRRQHIDFVGRAATRLRHLRADAAEDRRAALSVRRQRAADLLAHAARGVECVPLSAREERDDERHVADARVGDAHVGDATLEETMFHDVVDDVPRLMTEGRELLCFGTRIAERVPHDVDGHLHVLLKACNQTFERDQLNAQAAAVSPTNHAEINKIIRNLWLNATGLDRTHVRKTVFLGGSSVGMGESGDRVV